MNCDETESFQNIVINPIISDGNTTMFSRVLINGVLYASTMYHHQAVTTCDYVLFFNDGFVGFATMYLTVSCSNCSPVCDLHCVVIAEVVKSIHY